MISEAVDADRDDHRCLVGRRNKRHVVAEASRADQSCGHPPSVRAVFSKRDYEGEYRALLGRSLLALHRRRLRLCERNVARRVAEGRGRAQHERFLQPCDLGLGLKSQAAAAAFAVDTLKTIRSLTSSGMARVKADIAEPTTDHPVFDEPPAS